MGADTSGIRGLVSDAIGALDGWTVSRWGPDLFGRDTDHLMHQSYCVEVPETAVMAADGRQRVSEGLLVESTVLVRWAWRLRGDAQSADYDASLDAEQDIAGAARGITTAHVLVGSMTRTSRPEGWVLGTVRLRAIHRYALA